MALKRMRVNCYGRAVPFGLPGWRRKVVAETAERKAKRMAAKAGRLKLKTKLLEMLENVERMVLDVQSSGSLLQGDAEGLASTHEKLKKQKVIEEEDVATLVQSRMRHGPRIGLFFQWCKDRNVIELLTSLQADMEDVRVGFVCEEQGHEHYVDGARCRMVNGALGEDRLQKLQPLLASGLEVVARAMSTLPEQPIRLDSVTLSNLRSKIPWDLRVIDLEKHGKLSKYSENAEELKRAADTAAECVLSFLEEDGVNLRDSRCRIITALNLVQFALLLLCLAGMNFC